MRQFLQIIAENLEAIGRTRHNLVHDLHKSLCAGVVGVMRVCVIHPLVPHVCAVHVCVVLRTYLQYTRQAFYYQPAPPVL